MVWNFKNKFQPLKIAQKLSRSDFLEAGISLSRNQVVGDQFIRASGTLMKLQCSPRGKPQGIFLSFFEAEYLDTSSFSGLFSSPSSPQQAAGYSAKENKCNELPDILVSFYPLPDNLIPR